MTLGKDKNMKVTTLDEGIIQEIGHAFGYYNYDKGEYGLINAFPSKDSAAEYICGYARMTLQGGMLYTTGENGEGYIAYKLPGQKISLKASLPLIKALFSSMKLKELFHFMQIISKGGPGLSKRFDKEKKSYIFVDLVCVRESYQGQGYMRKLMNMAFKEGNRLGVPVILDTDAKSKCEKYMHLGMELASTREFGEYGVLYDLIKYPDSVSSESK